MLKGEAVRMDVLERISITLNEDIGGLVQPAGIDMPLTFVYSSQRDVSCHIPKAGI